MTESARTSLLRDAVRQYHAGKLDDATRLFSRMLEANPADFDALHALGIIRYRRGDVAEAERLLAEAVRANPQVAIAHFNHGNVLQKLKRPHEALAAFDRALGIEPRHVETLTNRGGLLARLGRFDEALDSFGRALAQKADSVPALINRASTLFQMKRFEDTLACCDKGLALAPTSSELLLHRGNALTGLGRPDDAVANFAKALAVAPDDVRLLYSRAMLHSARLRYEDAARDYAKLLSIDPDCRYARGNLLQCRLYFCDWQGFEELRSTIASELQAGKRVATPMVGTMVCRSAEEQLRCSRIFAAHEYPAQEPLWRGEVYRHDRIRLAYLAPEFARNPVFTQIAGAFEHHDKGRLETFLIPFGQSEQTAMRMRVEGAFEHVIDIRGLTDAEAAALLRAREIDIAVDLAGHTGSCRTGIFARRPAPVQVNYLGFPATMGAEYMDYIIADWHLIPDEHFGFYSEKAVHLPDSYMPNGAPRAVVAHTPSRAEAGLPDTGFVFCSFNNTFKILPAIFDIWMRLLRLVPGGVLWLPQYNSAAAGNLRREAKTRDVDPERLVFAPFTATEEEHLARLKLADLSLDALPYNAHATSCDALLLGLPVLTIMGDTFAGRVGASLLHAIGLPELVTHSLAEYEALALKLAREPTALAAIRTKLARNRETYPLFDTARFTRHLEAAYVTMWERWQRGLSPAYFAVDAIDRAVTAASAPG
jgi:predicted O-linked N-acetylglucosamine transferase (SPINDLY family)